jgi:hypothetical protein
VVVVVASSLRDNSLRNAVLTLILHRESFIFLQSLIHGDLFSKGDSKEVCSFQCVCGTANGVRQDECEGSDSESELRADERDKCEESDCSALFGKGGIDRGA